MPGPVQDGIETKQYIIHKASPSRRGFPANTCLRPYEPTTSTNGPVSPSPSARLCARPAQQAIPARHCAVFPSHPHGRLAGFIHDRPVASRIGLVSCFHRLRSSIGLLDCPSPSGVILRLPSWHSVAWAVGPTQRPPLEHPSDTAHQDGGPISKSRPWSTIMRQNLNLSTSMSMCSHVLRAKTEVCPSITALSPGPAAADKRFDLLLTRVELQLQTTSPGLSRTIAV